MDSHHGGVGMAVQLARSSIDIKNIIPLSLVRVNSPRVSSSNASRWTIKIKSSQMSSVTAVDPEQHSWKMKLAGEGTAL